MILAILLGIAAAGILGWLLVSTSSAAAPAMVPEPEPTGISPAELPLSPPPITPAGHEGTSTMSNFAQSVEALIRGIASAEGFYDPVHGALGDCSNLPCRSKNPCDLTESFGYANTGPANAEGVLSFTTLEDGWNAARHKARLILGGQDPNWPAGWTLEQMGHRYTGQPFGSKELDDWISVVAGALNVSSSTTLREVRNA